MSKLKQTFATVTILSVLIWGALPGGVSAVTAAELQVQIDALMAQLGGLQAQLPASTPSTGGPAACSGVSFSRNLTVGSSGTDVKCLQALLNQSADTQVAASGVGSAGSETLYFGNLSRAAVVKFQEKYSAAVLAPVGLSSGTGFVGSSTRAQLTSMLSAAPATTPTTTPTSSLPAGCTSTAGYSPTTGVRCDTVSTTTPTTPTTPAPTTGPVSVSLASDNPGAKTLGASSAYNTVVKVQVNGGSAGASVTSVTVERFGLSVDTNVSGVLIVDADGNRKGNVVTLASNVATIPFDSSPIIVPANGSTTFSVQAHMAAAATAGTMGFKVTGVSGTPSGLPVTGNLNTLSATAGILGALTVDVVSQTTTTVNVDIGQTDYVLTKFRFAAGANEDVKISKLTLFQNGTAADADLTNFDLVDPNGNVLATVATVTNKVVTFNLATPYTLAKGTNRDLTVRVDVVSGSSRTGQAILQNDYDVVAMGVSTGLGILATAAGVVDAGIPIGDITTGNAGFNHLTVSAGTMTINKSSSSPSGTFGIGQTNITIAVWELQAQGEDIQIQRADIELEGTIDGDNGADPAVTTDDDVSGTVKLMTDAGQTLYSVAGTTAALYDADASASDVVTFSTYYTIPAGTILKVKLVADASSTISNGDTAIGGLGDIYFKRMTSNTYGTASGAVHVAGNTMTASTATLTVVNNASLGATTLIEGQSEVLLGSYLLQTSSSEGVNVSSIKVDLTGADAFATTAVSNLKLKRMDTGAQIGSTVAAPTAANTVTVSGQLNIAASTTVQVNVYGNLSTAASDGDATDDTYITDIDAAGVTGTGGVSGTTINSGAAITGRTLTIVEGGTLTLSIDSSGAASSQFLTSGATGVEMGRVKLASTVEDAKITRLVLRTVNGSANIANVKLLGTGLSSDPSVPLTAGTATFTFASGSEIIVPAYGSRVVTAVVDLSGVGTTVAGRLGVLGFGTADALGSGSGLTVQERLTGTVEVVTATSTTAATAGDVIYYTVTATTGSAGTAGTNTTPGFYVVTTVTNTTQTTTTGSLRLNGATANNGTYWAAGDVVTTLTKANTDTDAGATLTGFALAVGDLVYVHDASTVANDGFYTIATAVASGANFMNALVLSGDAISTPGTALTFAEGDFITKFTNANGLTGNTMRFEEVEPVITVGSTPVSGSSATPTTTQTVAMFNVKASGARDITFDTLAIEKTGANSAWNVKDFKLYNGTTLLAEVSGLAANTRTLIDNTDAGTAGVIEVAANGTIGFAPSDTVLYIDRDAETNSRAGTVSTVTDSDTLVTSADIIPGNAGTGATADYLIKYSVSDTDSDGTAGVTIAVADGSKYQVGDQIYVIATTAGNSGGATVASVGATSITLTLAALTDLADNAAVMGVESITIYNITRGSNTVVFGAATQGTVTALASQTITAGQTLTLTIEADTTYVKRAVVNSAISTAAASFGVKIPGTTGPLQVTTSQVEGFNWDYTPLNTTGAATAKTESDSYPVNGPTLNY